MSSKDDKDKKIDPSEPEAEQEEVEQAEAEEPAQEPEAEPEAEEEVKEEAKEEAKGEVEAAKQQGAGAEAGPEEDEGWPKSWIVTTAILGIVAIIIIARLVGQAKGREDPVPRPPGGPAAAQKKHQPKHQPKKEPKQRPKAPEDKLLVHLKKVTMPSGMHCLGSDKKFHLIKNHFERIKVCLHNVDDNNAYRLELLRTNPEAELEVMVIPPPDLNVNFLHNAFLLPTAEPEYWFGGAAGVPGERALMAVINNPEPRKIEFGYVRFSARMKTARPPGQIVARMELKKPSFKDLGPTICLGRDAKLHKVAKESAPPEKCTIKIKGATVYQLQFDRLSVTKELAVNFRPLKEDQGRVMEAFVVPRPEPGGQPDVFEGKLRPGLDQAVLLLSGVTPEMQLKSILFVAKKH